MFAPRPREGMPSPRLDRATFVARFKAQFPGTSFEVLGAELDRISEAAWQEYEAENKSPRTRKAGPGYADPDYDLSVDWIAAKEAGCRHRDPSRPSRILVINGSTRSEHTCPGEMSKSWRLTEIARETLESSKAEVEVLDLSRLASEYGRHIHPCKACFSTAAALCHWPCSCYLNYSLGQAQDWMNEIYPMWVEAHGILIVSPVH